MKAMLLAAGRGERLRPLTDHTAKPLLKAGAYSLIEHHLHNVQQAGIRHVVINTCWQADKIANQLGSGYRYGLNIQYSYEPVALETAGGIANALPLLGDQPFLVISADVWTDFALPILITSDDPDNSPSDNESRGSRQSRTQLVLVSNPPHNPAGDFGLENEIISSKNNGQTYTYSGIGVFDPALFRNLNRQIVPLRDVLNPAISKGQVSGLIHSGSWFDAGTIERLEELRCYLGPEPTG